jgi:hypothetical protein
MQQELRKFNCLKTYTIKNQSKEVNGVRGVNMDNDPYSYTANCAIGQIDF